MTSGLRRLVGGPAVDPDELRLAGIVAGALFVLASITFAALLALPGVSHAHSGAIGLIAILAAVWGGASIILINGKRAREWGVHCSCALALLLIGFATSASGGAASPAWVYLFLAAVFAAYFFRPPVAIAYLAACVLTQSVPMLYDARSLHDVFIAQFVIAGSSYLVLGAAILAGKRLMFTLRSRAEELAAEQSALRRVATAVVSGEYSEFIYELVARELALLLRAGASGILRFEGASSSVVMGAWADHAGGRYPAGTIIPVPDDGDIARARNTGVPVRIDAQPPGSIVDRLGYRASVVAPIQVGGQPWGVLAVTAASALFTSRDEDRLLAFGDLLATAIVSIEDREKLSAQASSDPLTGLANHRTLQARLATEVARATRHGRTLSVAVLDIDHFKQINDHGGHDLGDEMLRRVAECLRKLARTEDTLGRLGGDEFAWVLPDTDRHQALAAIERARSEIAKSVERPFRMSVSGGICDTTMSREPSDLISLADCALYWSKAHGRDQCWVYDPEVIGELSDQERAERLERSHALVGLRAVARAIDAKIRIGHSEQVAELAGKLALAAGWSPRRARLLQDAAVVHDIGTIAMPDELLSRSEPLTDAERERLQSHSTLAAKIVEDVLTPEQVAWIRAHRERADGTGYPEGLTSEQIPEGAALLAAADRWEALAADGCSAEDAITDCQAMRGRELTDAAVEALTALHAAGELGELGVVSVG